MGTPRPSLSLLGICHHIILFFFESVANFFGSQERLFIGCLTEVPVLLENISLIRQNAREQLMNLGWSIVELMKTKTRGWTRRPEGHIQLKFDAAAF